MRSSWRCRPALLARAVSQRRSRGRALDLGCGEGVYSAFLAQEGFDVTGIDFVPAALAAAADRATAAGVAVDLHEGDVLDYSAPTSFDLVLDSGCLHHLPKSARAQYRSRLDEWLAPGGDYVLVHFAHRPQIGWLPKGPQHLTRDDAEQLFTPLRLESYDETSFDVPFPMGRMRAGVYWFTRPLE
ncbi:MAG: class I SAM-dependent methyltransferase [Microthrixaceae bacterium]